MTTTRRTNVANRATLQRETGMCVTDKDGVTLCDERAARDAFDGQTMTSRRFTIGSVRCRCGGCGRHFGGVTAFDSHQRLNDAGDVLCIYPGNVGLTIKTDGRGSWWIRRLDGAFGKDGDA